MTWNILNKKKLLILWDEDFYGKNWRAYRWLQKYFTIKVLEPKRLTVNIGKSIKISYDHKKLFLKKIDLVFVTKCQRKYSEMLQTIIQYCKDNNIKIFQQEFLSRRAGKISVYTLLGQIWLGKRIIPTDIKLQHNQAENIKIHLIKDSYGYKGQNIKLYQAGQNEDILDKLIQPFIPNEWDIRVLVLWGEIICAYKRKGNGWLTNNISQWGSSTAFTPLPFMKKEVKIIADKLKLEWFWVDYIQDSTTKKRYILEINIMPWTEWTLTILKQPIYEVLGSYLYKNH